MGKIKSKLIKRASEKMIKKDVPFTKSFEENKKILGKTMPNKKIRNQISGYIARLKKIESKKTSL